METPKAALSVHIQSPLGNMRILPRVRTFALIPGTALAPGSPNLPPRSKKSDMRGEDMFYFYSTPTDRVNGPSSISCYARIAVLYCTVRLMQGPGIGDKHQIRLPRGRDKA